MTRDIISNVSAARTVSPAVLSAAANGVVVDVRGFDAAMLVATTGAIVGAGDFGVKLQHGDLADGSDMVDVTAADLQAGSTAIPTTLVADTVYLVGYAGAKRYLRAAVTKASGTSIALSAAIVSSYPSRAAV